MIPARQVVLAAALLWLAAVLQGRVAHGIAVRGAQPDLPLVTLASCAILVGSQRGALLGFWAGLLAAAMGTAGYGSVFASRIAAGAFAGGVGSSLIRANLLVPTLVTLAASLLAEVVCTLIAPSYALHHPRLWLRSVGGELAYNTVLALPVYGLLRLCRIGQPRDDPFGQRS